MSLAGLPLATLFYVGGAMAALVMVFYILKLRRRPIAVPYSRIWERILRDKEATNLFSQLKRLLSLLLQLALVAALVIALGDPRIAASLVEGRNVVVLVDASASMKATDVPEARIGVAKKKVHELVRGLGGSDKMLIAQMDAALTPLSTMTGEVKDLEAAVDQIHASDTRADFPRALRFALDSLRGLSKPQIVVVSDGALGDPKALAGIDLTGVDVSYVAIGEKSSNIAITGFSVRRYPLDKSRSEVMLEVTNTTEQRADVELTLLGDGAVIDVTRLSLGPNERLPRFYKDLAGASRTLEATIKRVGADDFLPADDHTYALMPERRRSRILLVTKGNTYLEAALLLDEYLNVSAVNPKQYPPPESYDVTIFDGVAPEVAKNHGSALYLDPPDVETSPVGVGKKMESFGFDIWDRKSPVLRWMAMEDIQAAFGHVLRPSQGDRVIGASEGGPILVTGRRGGRKFVALGFDPRNSDFVLRVAWPLFVLNSINDFVEEDTGYVSSYRTGEVWYIPAPSDAPTVLLEEPGGAQRRIPVKQGRAVYLGQQAGFYKLVSDQSSEKTSLMFAANLSDPAESHVEPQKELAIQGKKAAPPSGFTAGVRREVWIWLLLAVMAASLVEWLTYHRRITV